MAKKVVQMTLRGPKPEHWTEKLKRMKKRWNNLWQKHRAHKQHKGSRRK